MIRRLVVAAVFLLLVAPGLAQAAPQLPYYLALGDSLARGVQPLPNGTLVETNQGYVDDLYGALRLKHPFLQLKKLGCSGETTTTMLSGGGPCFYPAGSQLEQAIAFHPDSQGRAHHDLDRRRQHPALHQHRPATSIEACLQDGVARDPERPAADRRGAPRSPRDRPCRSSARTSTIPFLAAWVLLPQPQGPMLAQESLVITQGSTSCSSGIYTGLGAKVADVAGAFRITDFSLVPVINIPRNVFIELTWTWIGAPPPRGPDTHPNATGYLAMAGAFYKAIGSF